MKKFVFLSAVMVLVSSGCGSLGGGAAELKTSYVTASAKTTSLSSDVVKWTVANSCTGDSSRAADSVDVEVTLTPYSNTGSMVLPVKIVSATISYERSDTTTPPMPTEYTMVGYTINPVPIIDPSSSATPTVPVQVKVTVPIQVTTLKQKTSLQSTLACNSLSYKYHTKIVLNLTEIGTGKTSTAETNIELEFADFIDK